MSITSRVTLAALLLATSALVLASGVDPRSVGRHAAPCLIVVLIHAWTIAVAERSCANRGGSEVPRFLLAPRLVSGGSGLARQLVLPVVLLGLASRDPILAVAGLGILAVFATEGLRRMVPFVLPAAVAVYSVTAMDEFHTFGDLLDSAQAWIMAAVGIALGSVVVAGPLLRTDMGGRLTRRGRMVCVLAGVPTYLLGVLVSSHGDLFGGAPPDLFALAAGLLGGGMVHSLIAGLLAKSGDVELRDTEDFPWIVASDVGKAISILFLPVLALVLMGWVPLSPAWDAVAAPSAWIGLGFLLMVVPSVCAAVLFAWALDRADGRYISRAPALLAGIGMALWFFLGPAALAPMFGTGGVTDMLSAGLPAVPRPFPMVVGTGGGASLLSRDLLGGDVTMHGVPVADLARSVALMVAAATWLAVRTLRHTVPEYEGARWANFHLAAAVTVGASWLLAPRIGPVAVPLGCTLACVVGVVVEATQVHRPIDEPEPLEEQDAGGAPDPA